MNAGANASGSAMYRRALLVALACAVAAVSLFVLYLKQYERESSGGEPVRVLVVLHALEAGAQITDDALGVKDIPQAYVEDRAVRESDKNRVLGLRVGGLVQAQQTLMWSDLSVTSEERRDLSTLVQPGRRAVTISFKNGTMAALLRPGDSVDVIAVAEARGEGRVAKVLLQNVLVLAVGNSTAADGKVDAQQRELREGDLTLSVTLAEAQQLALARERGDLSVAVRNVDDAQVTERAPDPGSDTARAVAERAGPSEIKSLGSVVQ
jgi:pilus assembly protein CpaB